MSSLSRTPLTRSQIKYATDANSYARGKVYYEQDRVLTLQVVSSVNTKERGVIQFESTVRGSAGQTYNQSIRLEHHSKGEIEIKGNCSCPVGFNCKHIVAACLLYQSQQEAHLRAKTNSSDEACLTWIEEFGNLSNSEVSFSEDEFIVYLLSRSRYRGKLQLHFARTRRLKNGSLAKGRLVNLDQVSNIYHQGPLPRSIDHEIGNLLHATYEQNWREVLISGQLGFLALTKIMQTGRGIWGNAQGQSLLGGQPRALSLQWQKDQVGDSHLSVAVQGGGEVLLTQPLLYFDLRTGEVGPLIEAPYTADQMEKLLNAPTVPARLSGTFSERFVQRITNIALPAPDGLQIEEIAGEVPRPSLVLVGRVRDGKHFHLARLRFRYGNHEIAMLPQTRVAVMSQGDKILRIERDLKREQEAISHLTELQFQPVADENKADVVFLYAVEHASVHGINQWQWFLDKGISELRSQGWLVAIDDSFRLRFHNADTWAAEIDEDSSNNWFDLSFDVKIAGRTFALLPLVIDIITHYEVHELPESLPIHLGNDEYVNVPRDRIKLIVDVLYELYGGKGVLRGNALRLSRYDALRVAELDESTRSELNWRGGVALREIGRRLKDFSGIAPVNPPKGLRARLRPYQQLGLNWLQFLREYQFGGVLADDMGLGKTIQTLCHLLVEKEEGRLDRPSLIVAPTSLMSNWRREAEQFTPDLRVLVLQGKERFEYFQYIKNYDIVLTTYPLLARDEEVLLSHDYHVLVLDEAQFVKNSRAVSAQVVRRIKAKQRICLTGTPMENHLGELWALFDFLMPGFLGNQRQFTQWFRTPIEKHRNLEQRQRLARRVLPFLLRRTKKEVASELPDKTEIIRAAALGSKQAMLYESVRISMEKRVRDAISNRGLARSHIMILDALLKLRQICCDPRLLSLTHAKEVRDSAKLELLMQIVPELVEEGRRILLFSQFTSMLELIEKELNEAGIAYVKLTGQTRDRDKVIMRFKNEEIPVFLISLKAGGVGLNLTEADTVIHYDPWWNPAAEDQATDRAHRIGQSKSVFVYKLVVENSVEEKILSLQAKKQALAQGLLTQSGRNEEVNLTAEDLQDLFAPLQP